MKIDILLEERKAINEEIKSEIDNLSYVIKMMHNLYELFSYCNNIEEMKNCATCLKGWQMIFEQITKEYEEEVEGMPLDRAIVELESIKEEYNEKIAFK